MENQEKPMKYMLICNNCNNKIYTTGQDMSGLVEVKTAPVPKRANGVTKDDFKTPKRYKCPHCGYLFKIVKLLPVEQQDVKKDPSMDKYKEPFKE